MVEIVVLAVAVETAVVVEIVVDTIVDVAAVEVRFTVIIAVLVLGSRTVVAKRVVSDTYTIEVR